MHQADSSESLSVARAFVILMAVIFLGQPLNLGAQTARMDPRPPELIETGIPAFVALGPEALGMTAAPVDLRQLPDGRLIAIGHGELAIGDGVRWDVFRQRDDDPRVDTEAVAIDRDGGIYAGIQGGIAQVEFLQDGHWHFVLKQPLPAELAANATILTAVSVAGKEWFWSRGSGQIVAWHPGTAARAVGSTNAVESIFSLGQDVFLSDQSNGNLFRLESDQFKAAALSGSRYVGATITSTAPFDDRRTLLGTISEGVLLYDQGAMRPLTQTGPLSGQRRINDLCAINDNVFAAALDNIGILFFDRSGHVVQVLDRSVDHRFSRVKRLLATSNGMLWALLNDGIARIEYPSRVSSFEPLVSTGLAFSVPYRYRGKLWLMSDGQAQRGEYDDFNRLVRFVVDTPKPYLTALVDLDGDWIAATHDGIFRYDRINHWTLLTKEFPHSPHLRRRPVAPNRWLYAAENEVGWLRRFGDHYALERIPVPELGHVFGTITDSDGVLWAELGNARVARVIATLPRPRVDVFGVAQGVPDGWAQLFSLDGTVRLNAGSQILKYDDSLGRFVVDVQLVSRFPVLKEALGRPIADALGRLWVTTSDGVRVINPKSVQSVESEEFIPDDLRPIIFTAQSDGVVWMNQRMHIARFDPAIQLSASSLPHAQITRIEFPASNRILYSIGKTLVPLSHWDNSLVVHFLAPNSPFGRPVTFDIKLDGTKGGWFSSGKVGEMTFNHLAPGDYRLHVRPRIGDKAGIETELAFVIRTPWYRSTMAYVAYVLGLCALVVLIVWVSAYVARREKIRLERLVASRTAALNSANHELNVQIQESIRKTDALKISEDRYRRLSDNAPDIIFRLNVEPDICFDYISPAVTRITGYLPAEFVGDPRFAQKITHPSGTESIYEIAASKNIPVEVGQVCWRSLDDRIVTLEQRLSPAFDSTGKLVAIEGIMRDITQALAEQEGRRRLEAQLMQSQKLESIGTLAGGIAHDFNNILTGILGYCELAARSAAAAADKALRDDLQMIRAAGLRARDLVAQILTFSRKSESKLAPVNLGVVVKEAVQLIRATTPASITIIHDCANGTVLADATQIHQVVINLCTNGIYAMRAKSGLLTITVEPTEADSSLIAEFPELPHGPCMRLTVSDTGCGMDLATLARSFDPFFTTKKVGEGTGLGLSTVQGIVTSHHGCLRVRSVVDQGTTVDVYLPRSSVDVAPAAVGVAVVRGRQQHILVVDDEQFIAEFIAIVLQRLDYKVSVFNDPVKALAAVTAEPNRFHAMVTDMTMPHLTGLELIFRVREQGANIPAIIATGYSAEPGLTNKAALERIEVMGKPFDGNELGRVLGQLLAETS